VSDNGWGMFVTFLRYKLDEQGKKLVKVDKFFASSQTCNVCGYKNRETT
ncbi:MAG: transposase, partial [Allobaculum sp.]|nr:transposase [Allobaculum sp.]